MTTSKHGEHGVMPLAPLAPLASFNRCILYALLTISRAVWRGGTSGFASEHFPRLASVLTVACRYSSLLAILGNSSRMRECFPEKPSTVSYKFRFIISSDQLVNTNYAIFSHVYLCKCLFHFLLRL